LYRDWRQGMAAHWQVSAKPAAALAKHVSGETVSSFVQALMHGLTTQLAADPNAFDRTEMLTLCLGVLAPLVTTPPARPPANATADPAGTANGQPTLSERVKELRLTGRMDGGTGKTGGTSWLPWVLCLFLAVGWAGFGIKWYRGSTAKAPDAAGDSAAPSTKS